MAHLLAEPAYAEALAGPGAAMPVPEWGAHVVRRPIAGDRCDAIGIYPMQVFRRGADIRAGLDRLAALGLVSMVLVPDPLLCPAPALARDFDVSRPFKAHYLIDPAQGRFDPTKHHRDRIRRGVRRCRVQRVSLADRLDDWRKLYAGLVERHAITGPAAFRDQYFQMLAQAPAVEAFAAFVGDACAGMTLWFAAEGVVYNHLTAANALGYANGANFALYDAAIAHFAGQGVINLGGGAGVAPGANDGLAAFKRGFANSEIDAHVCGAILDPGAYEALCAGRPASTFFPAYRAPLQRPEGFDDPPHVGRPVALVAG
jgi:hypothetical protein